LELIATLLHCCKGRNHVEGAASTKDKSSDQDSQCRKKAELLYSFNAKVWDEYGYAAEGFMQISKGKSLVTFYRATPVLFLDEVKQDLAIDKNQDTDDGLSEFLTAGPIIADPHFGNIGVARVGEDKIPTINDFDDATTGPRIVDIRRGFVSILILNKDSKDDSNKELANSFVEGLNAGYRGRNGASELEDFLKNNDSLVDFELDSKNATSSNIDAASLTLASNEIVKFAHAESAACRPIEYLPFKGKSSYGLPRFRMTCHGVTYELKATRPSAYDFSTVGQTNQKLKDPAERIVTMMSQLGDKTLVGSSKAFPSGSINFKGFLGAFSYYLRARNLMGLPEPKGSLKKSAKLLGAVIGKAHLKSGFKLHSDSGLDILAKYLANNAKDWVSEVEDDHEHVPKCLDHLLESKQKSR
jgi:hypothetical protein